MNMNAMLIRSSVLMVVALVMAFTATRQMPSAHAQSAVARVAAPVATFDHPVELATITVRPTAADLMEAEADSASGDAKLIEAAATDTVYETLTPNMPSLRMDMPYYSFGKALRRGVKE
jgi:hypothetical protein